MSSASQKKRTRKDKEDVESTTVSTDIIEEDEEDSSKKQRMPGNNNKFEDMIYIVIKCKCGGKSSCKCRTIDINHIQFVYCLTEDEKECMLIDNKTKTSHNVSCIDLYSHYLIIGVLTQDTQLSFNEALGMFHMSFIVARGGLTKLAKYHKKRAQQAFLKQTFLDADWKVLFNQFIENLQNMEDLE
jgi:hypothetical protein